MKMNVCYFYGAYIDLKTAQPINIKCFTDIL